MHVVTFYSYKGGVGRTMALINVAAELSRRGRKVLIVDFDLEAPGITSYNFCTKAVETKGIVDYITEYMKTSVAPAIDGFLHKCTLVSDTGTSDLWVMPAGLQDKHYRARFHSINWDQLYSEQAGYLLMENLKAQWEQHIDPDYVLIDSRTGHTDVSGICTRQLPDAVVFTYAPNRQNLSGLKQIVEEVKAEREGPRKKKIYTHFLASNVPNGDDEHQILEKILAEFKDELGYADCNTIRHYDNLELLDQVIFTLSHRRTRLARDYSELTDAIIKQNAADREGAIAFLADIEKNRIQLSWRSISGRFHQIETDHPKDAEVLSALGGVYERYDQIAGAINLYEGAIEAGSAAQETYRNLALLYFRVDRKDAAIQMFKRILEVPSKELYHVQGALRVLVALDAESVPALLKLPSIQSLDSTEKMSVVEDLRTTHKLLPSALALTQEVIDSAATTEKYRKFALGVIPLIEIALGRYRDAMDHLGTRQGALASSNAPDPFNYAMAEWAETGSPPSDLFGRVLETHDDDEDGDEYSANYYQCLAVASWATGNNAAAKDWLEKSRLMVNGPGFKEPEFTCWRYLNVRPDQFVKDVSQIAKLIDGEQIVPEFVTRNVNREAVH